MNELVKYQNDMNQLSFKGFTQTSMNMFMALCSKVKDRGTKDLVLDFGYIKKISRYDEKKLTKEDFVKDLTKMNEQLMSVNCKIITENKIIMFVLFPTFVIDEEKETLTVAVNEKFEWLLNDMSRYTIFELEEYVDLKSKYAKNLYRLMKQWRCDGEFTFHNIENFRELMDVPTTYTNKYMMERCVNVAIEEISKLDKSFNGFKCTPEYWRKRGKPLKSLTFTWEPDERVKKADQAEGQDEEQESFSNPETFEEYVAKYKGADKPSSVALKIAKDIEKGNKKKQSEGKKNGFNNFTPRNQSKEEIDQMELEILRKQGMVKEG